MMAARGIGTSVGLAHAACESSSEPAGSAKALPRAWSRNATTSRIDPDPQRLRELEERLDLRGVPGNGIHAEVLRRAGGQDADMLIACASLDETNLVACKIAHDVFQIPSTIARLRGSEFKEGIPAGQGRLLGGP